MEETLKSIRSVHLVMIGVCAAIALFAASPREIDRYAHAQKELVALREIDLTDLKLHVGNVIAAKVAHLPWLQPGTLFPLGKITASLRPLDLFPVRFDETAIRRLQDGAALEEWFKFFDVPHPIIILLPDEGDAKFRKFCADIAEFSRGKSQPELQTLSFKGGIEGEFSSPLPAVAICLAAGSPLGSVFTGELPAKETIISRDGLKSWLESSDSTRNLRQISDPIGPSLQGLRSIRNEIGAMKIPEAAQYTETRISSRDRKINVMGATVDEKLAVLAAPIAALLSLLYLLLIVRHLEDLVQVPQAELGSFPWVGLFRGVLPATVTYMTLWLPPIVCFWLIWTSRRNTSFLLSIGALGVTAVIAIVTINLSYQLHNLRKRVAQKV